MLKSPCINEVSPGNPQEVRDMSITTVTSTPATCNPPVLAVSQSTSTTPLKPQFPFPKLLPAKELPVSVLSNSKNSTGVFCRICHEGDGFESLISPCRCAGSVGLVHKSCLEKWLSVAQFDTCELCHHKLKTTTKNRPLIQWLCESKGNGEDQRNLVGDCVCLLLLSPLAAVSIFLCSSGGAYYWEQDRFAEASGLGCLASVLIFVYLLWLSLTIRYHCQVWFKWRTSNQEIRLLTPDRQYPERDQEANILPDVSSVPPVEALASASDIQITNQDSSDYKLHDPHFNSNQTVDNSPQRLVIDLGHEVSDILYPPMQTNPNYHPSSPYSATEGTIPVKNHVDNSSITPSHNGMEDENLSHGRYWSTPAYPDTCPSPSLPHIYPQVTTRESPLSYFTNFVSTPVGDNIYEAPSKGTFSPIPKEKLCQSGPPLLPQRSSELENSPRRPGGVFLPGLGQKLPAKDQ